MTEHWRNPETGQIECECCCGWALDYEKLQKALRTCEEKRKPKCPACNSVGMSHCSDPEHCGGPYWPDEMYRKLEADNRALRERVERLSKPVSDEESRFFWWRSGPEDLVTSREGVNRLIQARAEQPGEPK